MSTTYVVITVLVAAVTAWAASVDFIRPRWLLGNMNSLGVPRTWLPTLGGLKAAGALGLLAGIGVPLLGLAAAAGLVLFFVGAVITVLRAACYEQLPYPGAFLLLSVASLVVRLAAP